MTGWSNTGWKPNRGLSDRVAAMLSSEPHAGEVAGIIGEVRGELERVTAKRAEIEAQALDPQTPARVVEKQRASLVDLDFEIKRLNLALERLAVEHDAAVARDEHAREEAAKASELMATVSKALETRGEALAAELRELIATGVAALNVVDAANALLPKDEQLTPSAIVSKLRAQPERIVFKRETEVWLDEETGEVVPEDRLRLNPAYGDTLETLRRGRVATIRDNHRRARLTPVIEITFVPAHRFDWLNPVVPTEQVRYEKKIDVPNGYEISEELVGFRLRTSAAALRAAE